MKFKCNKDSCQSLYIPRFPPCICSDSFCLLKPLNLFIRVRPILHQRLILTPKVQDIVITQVENILLGKSKEWALGAVQERFCDFAVDMVYEVL